MAKQSIYRTCPQCGQLLPVNVVLCDCGHKSPLNKWHVVLTTIIAGIVSYLVFLSLTIGCDILLMLFDGIPLLSGLASMYASPALVAIVYCVFVPYFCRIFYSSEASVAVYASLWVGILGVLIQTPLCIMNFVSDYIEAALRNGVLVLCSGVVIFLAWCDLSSIKEVGVVCKKSDPEVCAIVDARRKQASFPHKQ